MERMMQKFFDVDSGEWQTLSISSFEQEVKRPCDGGQCAFESVAIQLEVKRLPLYYLLYIILPLCALILSFLLIFHLDIGQRASFGVGLILAISVYLMTISEYLPLKSDDQPFVGTVFVVHFFTLCLAVPVAEFNVHLAQRPRNRPSDWCSDIVSSVEGFLERRHVDGWKFKTKSHEAVSTHDHNVVDDVVAHDAEEDDDNSPGDCQVEWRKVGRFFDVVFSMVFLLLIILSPLIIYYTLRK